MTYTSCCASIIPVEGAPTLVVGAVSVVDVEVANEVEDEDFFEEALRVAELEDKVEALLIDKDDVDFDFEVDKGVVRATDANLFGTLVLAREGTKIKYVPTKTTAPSAENIHQAKSGLRRFLSSASKRASRSCKKAGLGLS